eukprot:2393272-Pleurochrysis_carterae.AAC.4
MRGKPRELRKWVHAEIAAWPNGFWSATRRFEGIGARGGEGKCRCGERRRSGTSRALHWHFALDSVTGMSTFDQHTVRRSTFSFPNPGRKVLDWDNKASCTA